MYSTLRSISVRLLRARTTWEHRQEVSLPRRASLGEEAGGRWAKCQALWELPLPRARISGLLGGWVVVTPEEEPSCFLLTLDTG